MIQHEMQTIRATLKELHRVQQNWIAENEMLRQANKKSQLINASASTPPVKPGSDEASRKVELQSAKKTRPATTTSEAQVQTQDTFGPRARTVPQTSNMASQSNSNIDELFKNFSQQLTKINVSNRIFKILSTPATYKAFEFLRRKNLTNDKPVNQT